MCFTPTISLATAIIEFLVVIYLFKRIKNKSLRTLPYVILILGIYQLTEFFLCTTNNQIWPRIGFITYTFLPILLMQLFYDLANKKLNKLFYSVPIIYAGLALFHPGFIISATCESFFLNTKNVFLWANPPLLWIYVLYYGIFPFTGAYTFIKSNNSITKKGGWKIKTSYMLIPVILVLTQATIIIRMLYETNYSSGWMATSTILIIISIILLYLASTKINTALFNNLTLAVLFTSIFMAYILYQLLPGFGVKFPSIYCQFSLLYTIAAILFVESYQS
jgi:hypothetical protein